VKRTKIGAFDEPYILHEIDIPFNKETIKRVCKLNRDFANNFTQYQDSDIMLNFDFHRNHCYQSISIFLHLEHPKKYQSINISYYVSFRNR
jgi:hypothetical protein